MKILIDSIALYQEVLSHMLQISMSAILESVTVHSSVTTQLEATYVLVTVGLLQTALPALVSKSDRSNKKRKCNSPIFHTQTYFPQMGEI